MTVPTGTSSYTHEHDSTGELVWCSEALDMRHGPEHLPTGFGFCPHSDDPWGTVVRIGGTD